MGPGTVETEIRRRMGAFEVEGKMSVEKACAWIEDCGSMLYAM